MYITTVPLDHAAAWKSDEAAKYPANALWRVSKILEQWYCLIPAAILITLFSWQYSQKSFMDSAVTGVFATGIIFLILPHWFAQNQAVWSIENVNVLGSATAGATSDYTNIEYSLETLRRDRLEVLASVLWATATKQDGSIMREAVALWRKSSAKV